MRIKNILNFKQQKKLTAIMLSVCVLLAGCTAFATGEPATEGTENTNNTASLYVEHLDTGVTKTITDENDIGTIAQILSSQNWQEGTADCLSEFKINLDGKEYYYHTDCGTVNDNTTNRSLSLADEQKSEIDRVLASMPQTEKVNENENEQLYYVTETDSAWTDESKDFCGYPTQEYFKEESETVAESETETVEQWTGFPEVIHLPMLEAGKYVFPLDMTNEAVRISRGYVGQYPNHDGIDFAGPYGTEIFASADGKVIKSEESSVGDGNHIVIEHANGYYTLYAHCSELLVKEGDEVKQGDVIAKIGCTGNSTGNHLHFEFGFGYGSEPDGGLSLDPYTAVSTRCAEDLNGVSISGEYQQTNDNSAASIENEQYYTAQAGDSPISIAKAHKLSVDELYAMNPDIKEKGVFVGDKVRVTQMIFGWPIGESPTGEGVRISRGFVGQYPEQNGVDIAGPKGTDILASADGRVVKALTGKDNYGNYIIIQHTGGYRTLYAHCSEILVNMGDYVNKGDVIAKMGSSGNATGNQLHFEIILENDMRIDPYTKW